MTPLTRNQEAQLRGRDHEVGEIVENCRHGRMTAITSPPGFGVTSLLDAGVAPVLLREGFTVAIFRDWQGQSFATHFRESMAAALRERALSGKPVAILLDQFEDYLRCHAKTSLAESFDIPLEPLSREGALEAIEVQARAYGLEVALAAIEALISAPIVLRNTGRVHPLRNSARMYDADCARLVGAARNESAGPASGDIPRTVGFHCSHRRGRDVCGLDNSELERRRMSNQLHFVAAEILVTQSLEPETHFLVAAHAVGYGVRQL